MKPTNWLETLNCAIEGVLYAAKTQKHMKAHLIAATSVLTLSLFIDLTVIEFALLALSITIVIFAELFNTALEITVDLVQEEYHDLAKAAKDVAAGAVLVASIGAIVTGYIILSEYFYNFMSISLRELERAPEHLTIIILLVVVIAVVLMKSRVGKGTPLHGGMPSGHSAISFSIFTSVALITMDPFISLLTFIMALMVSHSRLLLGIHTKAEVIVGGSLGFLITLVFFQIFF